MQSKKKMIVNTVFLVVIFALTIYGVFHGEDLGAMMEAMRRADVGGCCRDCSVSCFLSGENRSSSGT